MRWGEHEQPWTVEQERYLREHAGIDTVREICAHLKRSRSSVKTKASRMGVSLRHFERLTVICPKCGKARSKSGKWMERTGFCEVCRLEASYSALLASQAEAWADLPPSLRRSYEKSQARTGASRIPPRPEPPRTAGVDPALAQRLAELHDIDVERWECERLHLLMDACKQRTKRMREKSGTNPRKKSVDSMDEKTNATLRKEQGK